MARRQAIKREDNAQTTIATISKQDDELLVYDYSQVPQDVRQQVESAARDIKRRERRAVHDIVEIGKHLIEVKEYLPHGAFGAWIDTEFGWQKSMAANFMNVGRKFPKFGNLDHFGMSALYLLSGPSVGDEVIEEANALADQGKKITYSIAKQIVDKRKSRQSLNESVPSSQNATYGIVHNAVQKNVETQTDDHQGQVDLLRTLPPSTVREELGSNTVVSDGSIVYVQDSVRAELADKLDEQPDIVQVSLDIETARALLMSVRTGNFDHYLVSENRKAIQHILEQILD